MKSIVAQSFAVRVARVASLAAMACVGLAPAPAYATEACGPEAQAFLDETLEQTAQAQDEAFNSFIKDTFVNVKLDRSLNKDNEEVLENTHLKILAHFIRQEEKQGNRTRSPVAGFTMLGASLNALNLMENHLVIPGFKTLEELRATKIATSELGLTLRTSTRLVMERVLQLETAGLLSPRASRHMANALVELTGENIALTRQNYLKLVEQKAANIAERAAKQGSSATVQRALQAEYRALMNRSMDVVFGHADEVLKAINSKHIAEGFSQTSQLLKPIYRSGEAAAVFRKHLGQILLRGSTSFLNVFLAAEVLKGDTGVASRCPVISSEGLSIRKLVQHPNLILEHLSRENSPLCSVLNQYFAWEKERGSKNGCEFKFNAYAFHRGKVATLARSALDEEWRIIETAYALEHEDLGAQTLCARDGTVYHPAPRLPLELDRLATLEKVTEEILPIDGSRVTARRP